MRFLCKKCFSIIKLNFIFKICISFQTKNYKFTYFISKFKNDKCSNFETENTQFNPKTKLKKHSS